MARKPNDVPVIASMDLEIRKDGEDPAPYLIRIAAPQQVGTDEWVCYTVVERSIECWAPIHGGDSLQALILAVRFVRYMINSMKEAGFHFHFPDGSDCDLSIYQLDSLKTDQRS
ncbi:MAG: hypothetical protein AAGH48_07165 [Pseudomonadota bacterium]